MAKWYEEVDVEELQDFIDSYRDLEGFEWVNDQIEDLLEEGEEDYLVGIVEAIEEEKAYNEFADAPFTAEEEAETRIAREMFETVEKQREQDELLEAKLKDGGDE